MTRRFQRQLIACVVVALLIAVAASFLIPAEDAEETIAAAPQAALVEIPAAPAAVDAEELRGELERLAAGLLEKFPDDAIAKHVVALLYADLQMTQEASRLWRECLEISQQEAGPYLGLARVYSETGDDPAAVNILQEALAAGRTTADVYYQYGVALSKLGKLEEAAGWLEKSAQSNSANADTWAELGLIQSQLGRHEQAEASLRKAVRYGKREPGVILAIANACARQGKMEEAAALREQFTAQMQGAGAQGAFQEKYDAGMRQIAVATMARAATVYDRGGDAAAAEQLFRRALALAPESSAVCTEMVAFYRRQQKIADAFAVQEQLARIEPDVTAHHLNLASLAVQIGDLPLAERELQAALKLAPEFALAHLSLSRLFMQTNRHELARKSASRVQSLPTASLEETLEAYVVIALACQALGDAEGRDAAMNGLRRLSPNDPRLQELTSRRP